MSDSTTPWTVAHRAPLYMEFSRQEDWSGLPFLSPGDLPDPGIETRSLELQADSLSRDKGTPKTLDKEGCSHTRWKAQHKLWELFKKKKKFIWLHWVSVVACRILVAACGIYFPDQGSDLGPLRWKLGVLGTGPPGKSPCGLYISWQRSVPGPRPILTWLSEGIKRLPMRLPSHQLKYWNINYWPQVYLFLAS